MIPVAAHLDLPNQASLGKIPSFFMFWPSVDPYDGVINQSSMDILIYSEVSG